MSNELWELRELLSALTIMDDILDFGDQVSIVRDREMKGWEGPRVTAYNAAVVSIRPILRAHPEVAGYEPPPWEV